MNTRHGVYEMDGMSVKYWTEYTDNGKRIYLKPMDTNALPAIKGYRRNNTYGYYTVAGAVPANYARKLIENFKEMGATQ